MKACSAYLTASMLHVDEPRQNGRCSANVLICVGSVMRDRIDELSDAARESGLTIDLLHQLTQGLSRQAFLRVMGNASSLPSYMKSSDSPYLLRKAKAPSSESL